MTLYCIFCGSQEESEAKMEQPVCDRPECLEKAKQVAMSQFLETFIEHKQIDGQHVFRFRN